MTRWAPFARLWLAERQRSAELARKLAEQERGYVIHLALLHYQADRAIELAAAGPWSADDITAFAALGIDVER